MLKSRNTFLLALFSIGFAKTLIYPITFVDASVLLIMGAVLSYVEYKNQDVRMKKLEESVAKTHAELLIIQDKVSSIKVIQQAKPGSLAFRS